MKTFNEVIAREYDKGTAIGDIVKILQKEFGRGSKSSVARIAKRLNLEHPNKDNQLHAKIEVDSSSIGEYAMQPTKAQLAQFKLHCEQNGLPFDLWRSFWHKDGQYSSFFVNNEAEKEFHSQREDLIADLRKMSPKYRRRKTTPKGEHMLILPQADIHVGKWSEIAGVGSEYNPQIAIERARQGTAELLAKAKLHGVKNIVVCLGNDALHTDNGKTTTSGTPQDTVGTWFHNFRMAKTLYISIIEELALHADVTLVHVPDNHAYQSSFALSDVVAERFHQHPNVSAMITERHRKYVVYGQNLIMFTHGDGAKEKDLHWHLATESKEAWAKTRFRYVYMGHIHHRDKKIQGHQKVRQEKDMIGYTEVVSNAIAEPDKDVNIQYVRSQSGSDLWHDTSGYTSKPAMEAFLHHPTMGKVCDFIHYF